MSERTPANNAGNTSVLLYARQLWEMMQTYLWWWVSPTIAGGVLAVLYLLVASPNWRATQALQVRAEAIGSERGLGRFESVDAMKVDIEKIHGIARHDAVIAAALQEAGPPTALAEGVEWPTSRDIQALRETLQVTTSSVSDFGRSDIVYLSTDAPSRERAIALTQALTDQLIARLRQLRNDKSQSIISELAKAVQLSQAEMDSVTQKLQAFEAEVGADLVELRLLDGGNGEGNLRNVLNQTKNQLQKALADQAKIDLQRSSLAAMQADPSQIVATPSQLIESQPALKRLKDGLVDAQIREAELLGRMSDEHPQVIAAKENVQQVRQNLYNELALAIRGLQSDLQVNQGLIKQLEKQEGELNARLDRLAGKRAHYANLIGEVKHRATILEKAQKELADAEGSLGASSTTSLLTRIDSPTTGDKPLGPGKATIFFGGIFGGLVAGFGLVFLVSSPVVQQAGRRWSDFLHGRRSTDGPSGPGAPAAVPAPQAAAASGGRRSKDRTATVTPPPASLMASLANLPGGRQGRRSDDPAPPVAVASQEEKVWGAENDEDRRSSSDRRQGDRRQVEEK